MERKKGKLLGYGREEMYKCNIFFFLFQSFYHFQLFFHFLEKRVLSFLLSIQVGNFLSKYHLTQIQSSCDFDDFHWCHRISHFKFLECSMIWLTPAELQYLSLLSSFSLASVVISCVYVQTLFSIPLIIFHANL